MPPSLMAVWDMHEEAGGQVANWIVMHAHTMYKVNTGVYSRVIREQL